jgi:hypothetical protein
MKYILLKLTAIFVLISACKKEDDGSPTSGSAIGVSYFITAPACLIVSGSSPFGEVSVSYDSQKRIVRQSQNQDTFVTTYNYNGQTILETDTRKYEDGSTEINRKTHYLNVGGLIDSTREEGSSYTRVYIYNSRGQLIRQLNRDLMGYVSWGTSYQYLGGNRESAYQLSFDWQTGMATDSSLSETYTYYTDKPGKLEEWGAWIERTGKGNANELKSIQHGSETQTYSYVWGANGLPTQITLKPPSKPCCKR